MTTELSLALLQPGKINPRQVFDPAELSKLTDTIRAEGVLENLIVRPVWCEGTVTAAQLKEAEMAHAGMPDRHAIVSGERRFRAASNVQAERPTVVMTVPVRIVHLTDPRALEINFAEQLTNHRLNPLEEGEGFAQLMAYRDESGAPLHTVATVAKSMGVSHDYVVERLKLLDLPETLRAPVVSGELPASTAVRICRLPTAGLRAAAAEKVLAGAGEDGVMTRAAVVAMLEKDFMVQLKGAPFSQEDALLVPAAGKCSGCAHRSGNMPELVKRKGSRTDMCTNTECFRSKVAAAYTQVENAAKAAGYTVLDAKESARRFESHQTSELRVEQEWVELETRPMAYLLKSEVAKPPMWSELRDKAVAAGMTVEVQLAKDGAGRGRLLVNSAMLIAAAVKLGEPIFKGGKADEPVMPKPGEDHDEAFARGKREHEEKLKAEAIAMAEENKRRRAVWVASVRAVHAGLVKSWVPSPVWAVMLANWLDLNATLIAFNMLGDLLGLASARDFKKVEKALKKLQAREQEALMPILVLANSNVSSDGLFGFMPFRKLAKFAGVDLATVERETLAGLKSAPVRSATRPVSVPTSATAKTGGTNSAKMKNATAVTTAKLTKRANRKKK